VFAHPFSLSLFIHLLYGAPGYLVGYFFSRGISPPLLGVAILLPGIVIGFLVDLLGVFRKIRAN
jgi:hypothetical protein